MQGGLNECIWDWWIGPREKPVNALLPRSLVYLLLSFWWTKISQNLVHPVQAEDHSHLPESRRDLRLTLRAHLFLSKFLLRRLSALDFCRRTAWNLKDPLPPKAKATRFSIETYKNGPRKNLNWRDANKAESCLYFLRLQESLRNFSWSKKNVLCSTNLLTSSQDLLKNDAAQNIWTKSIADAQLKTDGQVQTSL